MAAAGVRDASGTLTRAVPHERRAAFALRRAERKGSGTIMQYRHIRQTKHKRMPRVILAIVLVAMISLGSVVTVMANTVDVRVLDGEETYSFSLLGTNPADIVARAEAEGMPALSDIDTYAFSLEDGVLTVSRGVRVSVEADGETQDVVALKGAAVSEVLADCGVTLNARDIVEPDADTVLEADTAVAVTRSNRVFVTADDKRTQVDVLEGTVADALKAADVKLDTDDTVTPAADTKLTNGMQIRVARFVKVSVTADGETAEHSVSAATVGEALEKAKITLGENDRLRVVTEDGEAAVGKNDAVEDGMQISVQRIRFEEVTETEALAYETKYEYSDEMYEDESETKTAGTEGTQNVTYKITYADGEEVSREAVSKEVVTEPVTAVVVLGTKEREAQGSIASGSTFTDASGESVSYAWSVTGSCTAYYAPPGAITSVGATAQPGYVAVDPTLIPYGSLLYITSPYGTWNYGYCYAMDTGGAAMAGDIVADLFYNTYEECVQFGRRDMTVYVIREGY